jgi:hypothetical protein
LKKSIEELEEEKKAEQPIIKSSTFENKLLLITLKTPSGTNQ